MRVKSMVYTHTLLMHKEVMNTAFCPMVSQVVMRESFVHLAGKLILPQVQ